MAGTSIAVEVTGDLRRFEKRLQGLVNFDFTSLNQKIGQAVLNSTVERFKQGVDPAGNAWEETGQSLALERASNDAARALEAMGKAPRKRKDETRAQAKARERALIKRQAARKTLSEFKRRMTSHKILIDTARLRNSLHVVATPDQSEVGTDVIYARIHQFGNKAGQNGAPPMPARPYLGLNADDRRVLEAIVEDHIIEKAGK